MKLPLRLSFGCLLVMSFSATAKSYDFIQEHLEQAFSSSVVLSDSDVFTAGFNNFDPNDWFKTDNDNLGTPESIENRKKYKSSTLPITLALSEEEAYHQHQLFFRLSASVIDDELSIANMPGETERYRQSVLGGAIFYRYQYRLTDHWTLTPAIGTHLLYYRNTVTYNNPQFKMLFSPLDGYWLTLMLGQTWSRRILRFSTKKKKAGVAGRPHRHGTILVAMVGVKPIMVKWVIQKGGISPTP